MKLYTYNIFRNAFFSHISLLEYSLLHLYIRMHVVAIDVTVTFHSYLSKAHHNIEACSPSDNAGVLTGNPCSSSSPNHVCSVTGSSAHRPLNAYRKYPDNSE